MTARSYLFVPGNRPDRFEKAIRSGASAVIIDLEDAVPPEQKDEARAVVSGWLSGERAAYVRVNGVGTVWHEEDVRALVRPGLAGVVLPKAERPKQIEDLAEALSGVPLVPIIETALGVWQVKDVAGSPRVERLAFGHLDFQIDTGIRGADDELLYARSRLVLASRVAGILPPLDGVTTALDDDDKLRTDVQRAVKLGFGGKLCVHPKQIGAVNEGFGPTAEEVRWARRVLEAAEAAGGAAVRVDGEMIDTPVVEQARRIVNQAAI